MLGHFSALSKFRFITFPSIDAAISVRSAEKLTGLIEQAAIVRGMFTCWIFFGVFYVTLKKPWFEVGHKGEGRLTTGEDQKRFD